jgi:hypothetical protein
MNDAAALKKIVCSRKFLVPRSAVTVALLLFACTTGAFAQSGGEPSNSSLISGARATHRLGFEGARNNSTGTLSIQDRSLRFQKGSEPVVQVMIASVQDVFVSDESKQVGGLPMTLGKAAVPFGGGRVVSLFAHKKYDTLALEYVGNDGGIHGAVFELSKGQAKLLRDQLLAMGAHVSQNDEVNHKNVEGPSEYK